MKFDLMNKLDLKRALSPAAAVADNTAQVSEILDTRGFRSIALLILIGALADADATFAVTLEEGDEADLSDASAVADIDLVGTEALAGFTFDDDNGLRKIGYVGSKRYIRATITPTGNAGDAFMAAVWALTPELCPAPNPPE